MTKNADLDEEAWKAEVRKRTREARGTRWKQEVMADLLGVSRDTYAKWENRTGSAMPPRYMPLFCRITGSRLDHFIEGPEPLSARRAPESSRRAPGRVVNR